MSYYDNVKDNIKENNSEAGNSEASFDTLKEAAQDDSNKDQESNDTPIEVLEEGGLRKDRDSGETRRKDSSGNSDKAEDSGDSSGFPPGQNSSVDSSQIEQKLERIIEQNDRMIEILESFSS